MKSKGNKITRQGKKCTGLSKKQNIINRVTTALNVWAATLCNEFQKIQFSFLNENDHCQLIPFP